MKYAYLDDNGNVVPTNDISLAYSDEQAKRKIIKQEHYKNHFISTVFLPLDHSFGGGSPVHFETYVFRSDGEKATSWMEEWGERATDKELALAKHEKARAWIDGGCVDD